MGTPAVGLANCEFQKEGLPEPNQAREDKKDQIRGEAERKEEGETERQAHAGRQVCRWRSKQKGRQIRWREERKKDRLYCSI